VKLARKLDIGMRVEATDGAVGEVADVVIDPVKWCVTHIVVQPERGHHEEAHLVPIEAVRQGGGPIELSWTNEAGPDSAVCAVD
jgi:sporulation protein YlmC with PRC-barrel domain